MDPSRNRPSAAWLLSALLLLLQPLNCLAWNTLMHADMARLAFGALPPHLQQPLQSHLPELLSAAMAPDLTLQDWPSHELNVHGGEGAEIPARSRVEGLYQDIARLLAKPIVDWSALARQLGLLSHYITDINQPLHTDERSGESQMHHDYESDAWARLYQLPLVDPGVRFRFDPGADLIRSAEQANRFYSAVLEPYAQGWETAFSAGVTRANVQRALEDVRDTWWTLLEQAQADQPRLALRSDKRNYPLGDSVRIELSIMGGAQLVATGSDLYFAVLPPDGRLRFLDKGGDFTEKPVPARLNLTVENSHIEMLDLLLPTALAGGEYQAYALLTRAGGNPMNSGDWVSNLAAHSLFIHRVPEIQLKDLADEIYLFPAQQGANNLSPLPLRRWDFIFLGESGEGGDLLDTLIPGRYSHILVYMGRDEQGTPYALEMTNSLLYEIYNLRLVRLPEFHPSAVQSESLTLPLLSKELWSYRLRSAKRLVSAELAKVRVNERVLLEKLEQQLRTGVGYQLEYLWSGNIADRAVYLVDDGLLDGASCTDFWLSNLESEANVCIYGSRMDAQALTDFYLEDPDVADAVVPASLNPLPFDVTASLLLRDLGFYIVDPDPHVFICDASSEVGVPVPDKLLHSPQLEAISPEPAVERWLW